MQSIRLKYRTHLERNCIQAREFMAMKAGGSEKAAMVQACCWPRSKRPSSPPGGGKVWRGLFGSMPARAASRPDVAELSTETRARSASLINGLFNGGRGARCTIPFLSAMCSPSPQNIRYRRLENSKYNMPNLWF
jgi:hypothetical protein